MNNINEINIICLDFDSTIIKYEGIDELARQKGCYQEVSRITIEAMEQGLSFRESLEKRLNILKPTIDDIRIYYQRNLLDDFSEGIFNLINRFKNNNKSIYVISGGFEQLIHPYTDILNIPRENVFCNELIFDKDGKYSSFDTTRLTSVSGGKIEVIKQIKKQITNKNIMMIGDGLTDLETYPYVNIFIGYGGNIERLYIKETVKKIKNGFYYTSFPLLSKHLEMSK